MCDVTSIFIEDGFKVRSYILYYIAILLLSNNTCVHLAFLYIIFPRMPDRLIGGQSTPLHYSQVRCTGEQESLLDCELSEITTGCSHDRDAAIVCRISEKGICISNWHEHIYSGL